LGPPSSWHCKEELKQRGALKISLNATHARVTSHLMCLWIFPPAVFNNSPGGALQTEWGSSARAPPARECEIPRGMQPLLGCCDSDLTLAVLLWSEYILLGSRVAPFAFCFREMFREINGKRFSSRRGCHKIGARYTTCYSRASLWNSHLRLCKTRI